MMGYDSLFFTDSDDAQMVTTALAENRVMLTRDTRIMKRGVVANGRLKAILITSDQPEEQMRQVLQTLNLGRPSRPFTICLECNQALAEKNKQQVPDLVPAYVLQTQNQYMECPHCHRIYWRGTHWQAMNRKLEELLKSCLQSD